MNSKDVSNSFQVFMKEAPEHSKAWMEAVQKLDRASSLDEKTMEIAYIAVLAAVGLESGIPFHVKRAKELGVSREDIKSAILLGLPAVGNKVIKSLSIALSSFDEV
ncbi:carboxymuconolactone decarboxylase family protein [Pseudoclostridium thermosuccinogenes]|uniref:carboxymuconolactone decarboxylase family protein n=1 Tax=Clostridium thermosuccinogenes TaxID=84032 RepID=UPI002FDAD1E2